jgi:hypothetical protein
MHTPYGGKLLRKLIRVFRREAREALRRGEEPPPTKSIGYTD